MSLSISDQDFADDVALLLAELLELLVPALEMMASRGCISRARDELAEDKSPRFGQEGG